MIFINNSLYIFINSSLLSSLVFIISAFKLAFFKNPKGNTHTFRNSNFPNFHGSCVPPLHISKKNPMSWMTHLLRFQKNSELFSNPYFVPWMDLRSIIHSCLQCPKSTKNLNSHSPLSMSKMFFSSPLFLEEKYRFIWNLNVNYLIFVLHFSKLIVQAWLSVISRTED